MTFWEKVLLGEDGFYRRDVFGTTDTPTGRERRNDNEGFWIGSKYLLRLF
jgi:hypothetical protein